MKSDWHSDLLVIFIIFYYSTHFIAVIAVVALLVIAAFFTKNAIVAFVCAPRRVFCARSRKTRKTRPRVRDLRIDIFLTERIGRADVFVAVETGL